MKKYNIVLQSSKYYYYTCFNIRPKCTHNRGEVQSAASPVLAPRGAVLSLAALVDRFR